MQSDARHQQHGDQHQHQLRPAVVDQETERHRRQRRAERQAGADEAEHLADIARGHPRLQHHVARGACRPARKTRGEQQQHRRRAAHRQHRDRERQRRRERDQRAGQQPMPRRAIGEPAAHQHPRRGARQVGRQRHRRDGEIDALDRVQHRDQPRRDAGAGHRAEQVEPEKEQHRAAEQQMVPRRMRRCRQLMAVRRRLGQDAALQQDRDHQRDAEHAHDQQRRPPAERDHQPGHHRRSGGEAQIAGEGVQREGSAHPLALDRTRQDRVVGRVDHRVADARKQCEAHDLPIGGGEAHQRDRDRH